LDPEPNLSSLGSRVFFLSDIGRYSLALSHHEESIGLRDDTFHLGLLMALHDGEVGWFGANRFILRGRDRDQA
jgi:hypothetical protein